MLLVIHNLPLSTGFSDVKALLLEKCGLRNLILDKLLPEDNAKKITVGLPTEEDAALLVRKINGIYLKGHQLYVQDSRQKPSEQPYRVSKDTIGFNNQKSRDINQQQSWNNSQQQSWNNTSQQGWNNSQQQDWNSNQQQQSWNSNQQQQSWNSNQQQLSWNSNLQQQSWNSNQQERNINQQQRNNNQQQRNSDQQQSYNSNAQQSWNKPAQKRDNDSQRKANPFLYQQQNQNQSGYGQELASAAALWAQQAQQVNTMANNQSAYYPQNVQYPRNSGQFTDTGYHLGWGQGNQGSSANTNANTSWGESSGSAQYGNRSQDSRQNHRAERASLLEAPAPYEQRSRHHSRRESPPRERAQPGHKRRWNDDEPRRRPADPPRDYRQQTQARPQPWANQGFQPSNQRFEAKPKFQKFESKKFNNKKQKFNSPNKKSKDVKPIFKKPPNPKRDDNKDNIPLEDMPWEELTEKQQNKIIRRQEFNRTKTVNRIIYEIFDELKLDQYDQSLKKFFIDPVRSRMNEVLADEKYARCEFIYTKFIDAHKNDKQKILEEAKQLQQEGVEPKLQKLPTKQAFMHPIINPPAGTSAPPAKKPKVTEATKSKPKVKPETPKPSGVVPVGKIPSYIDGDKKIFKAIKRQNLQDMETLRCPDVGAAREAAIDAEVEEIAKLLDDAVDNIDERQRNFLRKRAIQSKDDFKKMFKQKICQRMMNEGSKIVRIYSMTGKPPKKAELEPFMRGWGVLSLKKSDRKPFHTAHLDSYKTMDELCNMKPVSIGSCLVVFKPLHVVPKFKKLHVSALKNVRDKYIGDQIKGIPKVNILEKDWEAKLDEIKQKEAEIEAALAEYNAARKEKQRLEIQKIKAAKAAAAEKEKALTAENDSVKPGPENGNVKLENENVKPENGNNEPQNDNVESENDNVKPQNASVEPENDNVGPGNDNDEPENDNVNPENLIDENIELHSKFDVIDEVQGSDTDYGPTNDTFNTTNNVNEDEGKTDESFLNDLPVGSDAEIIFDDDEDENEHDQVVGEDIDLDNIDENDLEDY